ncbi:hypothetical protein AKO1_011546 [Acrasis kona]|uniref:UDENN domain-containing protein n=1 Tax=Acrasis kona TaxID=1008807 RepID=A0AAW2Z2P5_9EUKA
MTNKLADYFVVVGLDEAIIPITTSNLKGVEDVTIEKLFFKASVVDRYPFQDDSDSPLSHEVGLFCQPGGVIISENCDLPEFFTFILTGGDGARSYGACLRFFEEVEPKTTTLLHTVIESLKDQIQTRNSLMTSHDATDTDDAVDVDEEVVLENDENEMVSARRSSLNVTEGTSLSPTFLISTEEHQLIQELSKKEKKKKQKSLYASKSFCLLSHWPFYRLFKTFLTELYRISITPGKVPLERIISNFMSEVPLPPQGLAEVQYTIGEKSVYITRPPPNDLPLSEVNFEILFKVLSVENILFLFNCILNERQILFYSTHLSLLNVVSEALCSFIHPFHWHHVYIPVLPRSCIEFIAAPVPFIMGCDSSFLSGIHIPQDVIKVNLDNNMIGAATTRLPKLPERQFNNLKMDISKIVRDRGAIKNPTGSSYFDIQHIDCAFNLAPIPDEVNFGLSGLSRATTPTTPGIAPKFDAHSIRLAFYRFFVSLFSKIEQCIMHTSDSQEALQEARQNVFLFDTNDHFKKDQFIRDLPDTARPFMKVFLETQAFNRFMMDCMLTPEMSAIRMFLESIQDKSNKSKFGVLSRRDTPFLNDKSLAVSTTVIAISPDTTNLPPNQVYFYPKIPKLDPKLVNQPRRVKQLCSNGDIQNQRTSASPITPLEACNKDIIDSWKTILTTLVALSNQIGKKKSQVLMGKFRDAQSIPVTSNESKQVPTSLHNTPRKRGHHRTHSVPISLGGTQSMSLGGSVDLGEIDFTDIDADMSMLTSGDSSGSQVSFAGASLMFNHPQLSMLRDHSNNNTPPSAPSSPIGLSSGTNSFDQSNMPRQPSFDDGIMDQSTDSQAHQVRAKEIQDSNLFSRFHFDVRDQCSNCMQMLSEKDIKGGWEKSAQEYRTTCPLCGAKFVPRFTIIIDKVGSYQGEHSPLPSVIPQSHSNTLTVPTETRSRPQHAHVHKRVQSSLNESPTVNRLAARFNGLMSAIKKTSSDLGAGGNNGSVTPNDETSNHSGSSQDGSSSVFSNAMFDDEKLYHKLRYEYLSPLVLKKEVENLLGKEVTADAKLFKEHPLIFWNLICHFRGLLIPLNFLLPSVDWMTIMEDLTDIIDESKSPGVQKKTQRGMSIVQEEQEMLEAIERMNRLNMQGSQRNKK